MIRRVGVAVSTTLVASAFTLAVALPAFATPKDDPPVSGDPRATAHEGNATTCKQAGLAGEKVTVQFKYDDTKQHVTITSVPADIELTGTVIKGGENYNVYGPQHLTDLHAPMVGENNQNIPVISHWFACGKKSNQTTTTTTTTTTSSSTTTTSSSSSTNPGGGGSSTTTTAPAAQGSAGAAGGGDLAATGASGVTPLLVAGGALLLIGGGLLFLLRRTRAQRD